MQAMEWIDDEDEGEIETRGFVVDSDSAADWVVRKVNQARALAVHEADHHKRQLALITKKLEDTENWAQMMLAPYMDIAPCKKTKTKTSYKLPSGTLTLTHQQPEIKRDADAMCAYLIGAGMSEYVECVKPEPYYKPLWSALKPHTDVLPDGSVVYRETGEIIPGVIAAAREDKFEIV